MEKYWKLRWEQDFLDNYDDNNDNDDNNDDNGGWDNNHEDDGMAILHFDCSVQMVAACGSVCPRVFVKR
ncbi:hypothetical protein ElyMa_000291100 [Elysia marginata]|uniref:Uncharacterized protein n=1 Tax=Elysia marginata TaxID=1093978 RepID=A0AAV4F954_9GAST|nr:hypothetical protein ElyMa_000291100 [Elysia marginata]